MSRASRFALGALATLPLLLGACTTTSDGPPVQEYLDPQTAMTIRVVAEPFVYARDVPELAANMRDYLYVGAVELNNMGSRRHFWALISWSTIDRKRAGLSLPPLPDKLELQLTTATREYPLTTHEPRSIGAGEPVLQPPAGYLGDSWFLTTPADLRAFAASPPASIDVMVDGVRQTYTLWKRADAPLAAFIEDIPNNLKPTVGHR
ncbi:MAG: hypothetical protein NTZ79_14140 [Proteobacteria bacterium]|nr:hypothetical protein [Pseudomonadota bacterium]